MTAEIEPQTLRANDVANRSKINPPPVESGVLGCYAGAVEDGERALGPLRELDEPIADFSGTMPYVDLQRLFDEDYPDGMRYYWKSLYLDGLSDSAIDRIAY